MFTLEFQFESIKILGKEMMMNPTRTIRWEHFENILKIDIDCSFDKELSIEKVHDLTSQIEHMIRSEIKNAVIT